MLLHTTIKKIVRCAMLVLIPGYYAASAELFSAIHEDSGTTGAQILEITPDARSLGMGGAYTAVADDGGAAFYNPAGLAAVNHTEISLSRNQLFEDIEQAYLGYVYSLQDIKMVNIQNPGTFSATWNKLSTGDIPGRDVNGNLTRNFTAENNVLSFAYGKTVSETNIAGKFMAGVSSKFFTEKMYDNRTTGNAFDAGVLWKCPAQHLYVGLAVKNIGSKVTYVNESVNLPLKSTLGFSGRMFDESIIVDLDFTKPVYDEMCYNFGAEFWQLKTISLRLGYDSRRDLDQGLTAGVGLSLKQVDVFFFYAREINIDYAFIPYGDFGDLHLISLNLKLGTD